MHAHNINFYLVYFTNEAVLILKVAQLNAI